MTDDLTAAYLLGAEAMRDKLHKQADEIERLNDTRVEFIDMINKLVDERVSLRKDIQRLRKALKPFAYYAKQIPNDVSNTASASGTVGDLRAARAALGESDE